MHPKLGSETGKTPLQPLKKQKKPAGPKARLIGFLIMQFCGEGCQDAIKMPLFVAADFSLR